MTASPIWPAWTAALKMYSLPMKPAVGGTPASENMNRAMAAPSAGRVRPSPAYSPMVSRSSSRCASATMAAKAPRVMQAYAAR